MLAAFCFLLGPCRAAVQVTDASVRQSEDGPPLAAGTSFLPGETVYFRFFVTGYTPTPEKKIRLNYSVSAFDPKGVPLTEPVESVLDTALADEDKRWKPVVRTPIVLPAIVPLGDYKIVAKVTDNISRTSATAETVFHVNGNTMAASPELAVQNFAFYRGEDAQKPLQVVTYRPGDALFARFDITGYRFGERNTVDVAYDVAVLNPAGKAIYTQNDAAVEKSFSFYPKPYVPGAMSLSLQPNMRAGDYTIVLTVRDGIGHQTSETKHAFHVE